MEKQIVDIKNISIDCEKNTDSENEIICYNIRELAKRLDTIRQIFPAYDDLLGNNFFFLIDISYFKRISKERTIIYLNINNQRFTIYYEYIFLSKANKKSQRKELCGNLIEEIVEKFQPLKELKLHCDNLNMSGNYTVKHIINDCRNFSLTNLQLNNYVISAMCDNSVNSENFKFLQKFSEKISPEDVSLVFQFSKEKVTQNKSSHFHLQNFFNVLKNLLTKNSKLINLTFYLEDYMQVEDINEEEGFKKENFNFSLKSKSEIDLINFKISLINTNFLSEKLYSVNDLYKLPKYILYSLTPEFIEFNYVEIMNSLNSKLEKDVCIFRFSKVIYTKKFFCILNSLKNVFKSNSAANLNHNPNEKILKNITQFLSLKDEDIFEIKTHHLRIMLNLDKIKSSNKFMFNLVEDYHSIIERKTKYEDIFQMITKRNSPDSECVRNVIKLRPYDLNSVSKILSKISANNVLQLKDGRMISIGGKFVKVIKEIEYTIALNTIVEINKNYSRMKIFTFSENYFLSSFSSAVSLLDEKEEYAIRVGGTSVREFLPNFAYTPVYKINLINFKIERVLTTEKGESNIPGLIVNHKLKISQKNILEISDGCILKNYKGGLNVINKQDTGEEVKFEKNENVYVFDLTKRFWNVRPSNSLYK